MDAAKESDKLVTAFLTAQQRQISSVNNSAPPSRAERERQEAKMIRALRRQSERDQASQAVKTQQRLKQLSEMAPAEAAKALDEHCQYCGELLIPKFLTPEQNGKTRYYTVWPECDCVESSANKIALKRAEQAEIERAAIELYQGKLRRAGLVGWLADATFENYYARDDWPAWSDCKERVQVYTMSFLDNDLPIGKNWLILFGNYGTGKSHLGAAIIRGAIDAGLQNVYFRVWPEYLKRLQATFDKRADTETETEQEIAAELQRGQLVVIDDLDKRQPSEWVRGTLYEALNYRYNHGLPTVLTFNYGPADVAKKAPGRLALEDYLGRAVIDRIIGAAYDTVEFVGPSYRSGIKWTEQKAA